MPNTINILIVEDEFLTLKHLEKEVNELGYNTLTAMDTNEASELLNTCDIQLAILDINLNEERDGLWIGQQLNSKCKIPFIYLTAYGTKDIIKKAVKTNPNAYLQKPLKKAELMAAIELAIENHYKPHQSAKVKQQLLVKEDKHYFIKLTVEDIDYFEADKNYLKVFANGKEYRLRSTLKELAEQLPLNIFMQSHRSFLVNIKRINKFKNFTLLIGNKEIPLSRNFKDLIQEKL